MPVDPSLADLSDTLLVAAIVAYAVAMVLYAVEFAFGARGPVADRAETAVGARTLVGAGGPPGTGRDGVTSPDGLTGADGVTGPAEVTGVPTGSRTDRAVVFGRLGVVATVLGALAQVGSLTARGLSAQRVPWGNMYEFISVICLVAVVAWLVVSWRRPVRHLGMVVLLPVVLLLGLAGTVLYARSAPVVPALDTYWLVIHVSAAATASGVFLLGFVCAVLFFARRRHERRVADGQPVGLAGRLPDSAVLERLTFRVHAFAFPLWTFAVIAGAIWAEAAWGRYWGWDPKETWAFISWVVYAAYLHARATVGWRGPGATAIAVLGWGTMMVNLFAINLVVSGLHSYAGVG